MIASFRIQNFKSYRDATLPLAPLTLLIGANASGKSNAIEAIRLLSMIGEGRTFDDIFSQIQSSDELIRGSSRDLPRDPSEPIDLGCELADAEWPRLEVAIRVRGGAATLTDETITNSTGRELYRVTDYSRFSDDGDQIRNPALQAPLAVALGSRQAMFPTFGSLASLSGMDSWADRFHNETTLFRVALEGVRFFDPQPRRMRGYSYAGERVLKEDGSNLSSVLADVCSTDEGVRDVLGFVADLPEQPFAGIQFIRTERDDVMVRLREDFGGREEVRDAAVLSDGTLRVLGIAAGLLSARPGSTIVIEEIDSGVHPSRAETLMRRIETVAKERQLRVLLTTHNPALLDRLSTEAIPHVVCAYRDPVEGDSRLVRLEDLPSYPELVARGPLGQLMTRGVLDYFLKHQRSPEESREQARSWLDALRAQVGDA